MAIPEKGKTTNLLVLKLTLSLKIGQAIKPIIMPNRTRGTILISGSINKASAPVGRKMAIKKEDTPNTNA